MPGLVVAALNKEKHRWVVLQEWHSSKSESKTISVLMQQRTCFCLACTLKQDRNRRLKLATVLASGGLNRASYSALHCKLPHVHCTRADPGSI